MLKLSFTKSAGFESVKYIYMKLSFIKSAGFESVK